MLIFKRTCECESLYFPQPDGLNYNEIEMILARLNAFTCFHENSLSPMRVHPNHSYLILMSKASLWVEQASSKERSFVGENNGCGREGLWKFVWPILIY